MPLQAGLLESLYLLVPSICSSFAWHPLPRGAWGTPHLSHLAHSTSFLALFGPH